MGKCLLQVMPKKCCNFRELSSKTYIINKGGEVTLDQENGPHKLRSSEAKHDEALFAH